MLKKMYSGSMHLNKNQYYKENNLKPSVLCLGPSRTSPPVSNQKQDYRSKSEYL